MSMVPDARFADVAVLLIDGNNLLHRVAGSATGAGAIGLLGRLAAALPRELETTVVLDGPPDPGAPFRSRVRSGFEIRHAGRSDADGALIALVGARTFAERAGVVVVTDDRALADRVRRLGGRTRRLDWLTGLLGVAGPGRAAGLGAGRSGVSSGVREDDPRDGPATPWRPGRGATAKRGNPCRAPRRPGRRARPDGGR